MTYSYKASSRDGRIIKGFIEANNVNEAATFLRNRSLVPITIVKQGAKGLNAILPFIKKQSNSDLVLFTRQLSSMLTSGLTLMQALVILKEQVQKESMKEVINGVIAEVEEGKSFANAISKYKNVFSPIYISLIRAGETSGFLDKILLRLADNLEKQQKLRATLRAALMYPAVIVILMIAVMTVMMIFVIPQLSSLYNSLNLTLPITTQIVVNISHFVTSYWWFVLICLGSIIFLYKKWSKTETGGMFLDNIALKLPVFGNLIQKTILAEFSRTLGLLIGAGTLVVQSLHETADIAGNRIYQDAINEIAQRVEKGISIGDAMSVYNLFPPILVQMVKIGEQTGKLDESLLKVSEYFEREVDEIIKTLTTALEPIIMIVLGLGVAFLVISVITPIYSLTTSFH